MSEESKTETPVIEEGNVHFVEEGKVANGGGCGKGSAAKPEAEPGNLCIYISESQVIKPTEMATRDPAFPRQSGAGATGFVLVLEVPSGAADTPATGTWAVSAK
jgi:hypothetical protein